MSKYGESLGVWDLTVGRSKEQGALELHPTHKDNRALLNIISQGKAENDKVWLLENIAVFIKKLIEKEYPPENDSEKEELEAYVDSNLLTLMNEMLIAFKLAKREDLEAQQLALKKGMLPVGLNQEKP